MRFPRGSWLARVPDVPAFPGQGDPLWDRYLVADVPGLLWGPRCSRKPLGLLGMWWTRRELHPCPPRESGAIYERRPLFCSRPAPGIAARPWVGPGACSRPRGRTGLEDQLRSVVLFWGGGAPTRREGASAFVCLDEGGLAEENLGVGHRQPVWDAVVGRLQLPAVLYV